MAGPLTHFTAMCHVQPRRLSRRAPWAAFCLSNCRAWRFTGRKPEHSATEICSMETKAHSDWISPRGAATASLLNITITDKPTHLGRVLRLPPVALPIHHISDPLAVNPVGRQLSHRQS